MDLTKIYTDLRLKATLAQDINKFNNRVLALMKKMDEKCTSPGSYYGGYYYDSRLLDKIVFNAGLQPNLYTKLEKLVTIDSVNQSLERNVEIIQITIESLVEICNNSCSGSDIQLRILFLEGIKDIFGLILIDIGYRFKDGFITKVGATELDDNLVIGNLDWLKKYPDSRAKFANSLKYYLSKNYPDAITNAYSALEGIVKTLLGTSKPLDNNKTRTDLLSMLELDSHWGGLLSNYSKIAHEFSSRHGKKEQTQSQGLTLDLSEFYVYLTGSFIRLISHKMP